MKDKKLNEKCIKVTLRNDDFTKVKVDFKGGAFSPEEFTSLFMAILESYTAGLLETNSKEAVFEHFNRVFGIYLNKLVPAEKVYELDEAHKELKKVADTVLKDNSPDIEKETEDNRFAAYLLARDILVDELGLTEESADTLLAKRLGMYEKLNNPKGGEGIGKEKDEQVS